MEFRVKPYPADRLEDPHGHGHYTLCRVLSDIYLKTDDPDVKLMARVAYRIGKNFTNVMAGYKAFIEGSGYTVDVTMDEWQSKGFIGRIVKNEN